MSVIGEKRPLPDRVRHGDISEGARRHDPVQTYRHVVEHGNVSAQHRLLKRAARLGASALQLLDGLDFVFVCMDGADGKRALIERLESSGAGFIDVGMGLHNGDGGLTGTIRVTTSTQDARDHVRNRNRIPLAVDAAADPYASNIQVVELNALNAALAVIRWKKLCGFYADLEGEHFSTFAVDGNHIINEDRDADLS